jgi:hypothetical protein
VTKTKEQNQSAWNDTELLRALQKPYVMDPAVEEELRRVTQKPRHANLDEDFLSWAIKPQRRSAWNDDVLMRLLKKPGIMDPEVEDELLRVTQKPQHAGLTEDFLARVKKAGGASVWNDTEFLRALQKPAVSDREPIYSELDRVLQKPQHAGVDEDFLSWVTKTKEQNQSAWNDTELLRALQKPAIVDPGIYDEMHRVTQKPAHISGFQNEFRRLIKASKLFDAVPADDLERLVKASYTDAIANDHLRAVMKNAPLLDVLSRANLQGIVRSPSLSEAMNVEQFRNLLDVEHLRKAAAEGNLQSFAH